jgi:hypothetical protein
MNLKEMLFITRSELKDFSLKKWSDAELIAYINMGKADLISIVRAAREDYFLSNTTSTVSSTTSPNASVLALPTDFLELKEIICTSSGYESLAFMHSDKAKPEFRRLLIEGPSIGSGTGGVLYDIYGNSSIMFAPGFDVDVTVRIDYIKDLPDLLLPTDTISEIPASLHDYIPVNAATEALKSAGDPRYRTFKESLNDMTDNLRTQIQPRQIREPKFVTAFMEGDW